MKVLVTVGSTVFDSLVSVLDKKCDSVNMLFQLSNGKYTPVNHDFKRFIPNIDSEYKKYDLVVTHAGAGSVYALLEKGKQILVVPNLERDDDHQKELAQFVEENNFGTVMTIEELKASDLDSVFKLVMAKEAARYTKAPFIAKDSILRFVTN
jgi:beta-1,4-N-acetylglucosaminyltransferase